MNIRQVLEARALAKPIAHVFSDVDTFPAFVMQYVPENGTGGTAATAAFVQGGDFTVTVDGAAVGNANDGGDGFGTAGVIDTSAALYDTAGEFVDAVNGQNPSWRAYLVGARRATTMASLLAKSATSCIGANGLTFYFDASASDLGAVAISGEKFINNGKNGHVKDADDLVENILNWAAFTCGLTGNGNLKLYSCSQQADGPAVAFAATDDTAITKGNNNLLEQPFYTAKLGERLIVEISAGTSFDDIAKAEVIGRSAVLNGSRLVTEKNY